MISNSDEIRFSDKEIQKLIKIKEEMKKPPFHFIPEEHGSGADMLIINENDNFFLITKRKFWSNKEEITNLNYHEISEINLESVSQDSNYSHATFFHTYLTIISKSKKKFKFGTSNNDTWSTYKDEFLYRIAIWISKKSGVKLKLKHNYNADVNGIISEQPDLPFYYIGDRVQHETFGIGVIEKINNDSKNNNREVLEVVFEDGLKQEFFGELAKLKKISLSTKKETEESVKKLLTYHNNKSYNELDEATKYVVNQGIRKIYSSYIEGHKKSQANVESIRKSFKSS
tara:strand:- start:74 stop:931 length:858 start_codon:yes stop_codon:yes gene_type:complete